MNYEAFEFVTPVWLAPVLWVIAVIGIIMVVSAAVITKMPIWRFVVGGLLIVGATTALIVNVTLPENWREAEAKKLSVYYGIEISGSDLLSLDYPIKAPEKLEYMGTSKVWITGYRTDLTTLTLAVDSKRAYLFTKGKTGYVELEPVEFTLQNKE